ncbi:MAG: hypothetical protein ACTS6G_04375 [Candidatus Hodgkinia cicadicola]
MVTLKFASKSKTTIKRSVRRLNKAKICENNLYKRRCPNDGKKIW